jgi:hypothetical protein
MLGLLTKKTCSSEPNQVEIMKKAGINEKEKTDRIEPE